MDFHRLIRCRFFDSISRVLYIYEVIDERKRRNIPRNSSGKSYATILFSIFCLSSSIIILTFSCSTDLSLNFSHRLPYTLSSILYFLCLIDENVGRERSSSWLEQLDRGSGRFFLVLRSVSARFEAPPPLGARVFAVHSKPVPNELARARATETEIGGGTRME